MSYLTITQYAEKYGLTVNTVRSWTKQKNPPFEVRFSGTKAYIKDEEVSNTKVDTLEEIKKTQEMIMFLCKHFGLDVEKDISK